MEYINILLPVYNEQLRLENGIRKTVAYMDSLMPGDYRLTIVDNASDDQTPQIAKKLCKEYKQARYIRLKEKGVGVAFRAGVAENECPVIGYMDIDLSTDIKHLGDVVRIFRSNGSVGMVNASRWAKGADTHGRKWYRNITSSGLTWLLKAALGMKASDSICGFKFYRKEVVDRLVQEAGASEDGWFYIIELLLRAERGDVCIHELPVHWEDDHNSKVKVLRLMRNYSVQIVRLRKVFRAEGRASHGN